MERERPPYREGFKQPARTAIWPTLIIGTCLLATFFIGVHLLGKTRQQWEANRSQRTQRAVAFEREWKQSQNAPRTGQQQAPTVYIERPPARNPNFRCIDGVLFRKLPNGWENVPGERC